MGFIIAAAVAAAIIAFCFLCYKKAPPTQAIVVTGFGLSRPKVVCGRGVFVLPIVQRADRLNMRLLKIDVKTPETGVKTKEGVSLWLDSVVTVQVYSENSTVSDEEVRNAGYDDIRKYINSRQQAAISNFLGMDEAHINEKINDVLQGNLREIVSEMTVDQILTNRKQMAVSVVENARPDLAKMGLEVVTFNVQDVKDAVDAMGHNHGVIEAIGVEQEELVKKRASIAKAEAERDVSCAKAAAAMAANEKEIEAQTAIAQTCIRLFLKDAVNADVGIGQGLLCHLVQTQIQQAGLQAAAHQELHAQVVHLLGAGANGLGLELLVVLAHHLAADQSQRAVDLLVGSNTQLHAVLAGELVLKKFTEFFRCHKGTPIRISFQLC